METRSATRRAAADAFSSRFPTELRVEICSYLSYGELVATVGRLSRYHRELLGHSPLDALLFRKELSESDSVATPIPGPRFEVHPLLDGIAWQTGQDGFRTASGVPVLDLPARLEMATSPPMARLFINVFQEHFLANVWTPRFREVHRLAGVTVEDAIKAAGALLSAMISVGECEDCGDFHDGLGPIQRYDAFCFGRRNRTVILAGSAGGFSRGVYLIFTEACLESFAQKPDGHCALC
jgi:hypothetical protein